jgi:hypothetical protein
LGNTPFALLTPTFAELARKLRLAAGVSTKVMSERLGHATSSFTADVYQHVTPALEEQAAATVARLVFGP